VETASLKGEHKDQIEVKGEGIDTFKLTKLIREKVGHADIVSVTEEKKEEEKDGAAAVQVVLPYASGVPSYYPPIYHGMNQEYPCNPSCSIM
jgi:carbamoylphosphate synthase small subunit